MKRCLVADQSEVIRKIARYYLEAASFEVFEAESADVALAMIRDMRINAVILDWRLPGKTTVEFLSVLRFSTDLTRPLVVYLTTENDPADLTRALAAGADTYLLKPFDRAAFEEMLRNAGLSAGETAAPVQTSQPLAVGGAV